METHSTETSTGVDGTSRAKRTISGLLKRGRNGSLAMLVGSAMLARALQTIRQKKGRAALQALTGATLLGIGMRQRRSGKRADSVETERDVERGDAGQKSVSDEAHTERHQDIGAGRVADETASVYQSAEEPNPRGMSDRSDVEDDQGGDIDFVEGREPESHSEPHLEDEDAHDTRLHEEGDEDEQTEVDLSESAMADEVSEAAGPSPEQSYPASEGTDPEPSAEKAPERTGEGAVANTDAESETETDEESTDESEDGRAGERTAGRDEPESGEDEETT